MAESSWVESWTRWVLGHPQAVWAGLAVVVGAALLGAWHGLRIDADRTALIGDQHAFNRRFAELQDAFGDLDSMVVVLSARDRDRARAAALDLEQRVLASPDTFDGVFVHVPAGAFQGRALVFLDLATLDEIAARLDDASGGLEALLRRGLSGAFSATSSALRHPADLPSGGLEGLVLLEEAVAGAEAAARGERSYDASPPPWHAFVPDAAEAADGFVWTDRGGLVALVQPRGAQAQAVPALRALLEEVEARHPGVEGGLTGGPVLEHDELTTYRRDTARATWVALLGVTLLAIVGFRRLRPPVWISLTVCVAIALTLGVSAVWPGRLNLISAVFCVLLIGLGIDFGVHLVARYEEERTRGLEGHPAILAAVAHTGRAVAAGAVTTALAFASTLFTEVEGIREFGALAGVGILICLGVSGTLLPALLLRSGPRRPPRERWAVHALPRALDRWTRRFAPELALGGLILAATAGAYALGPGPDGGRRLRYDPDLLSLQAQDLESVRLAREVLVDESVSGLFAAVVVSDVPSLERVRDALERLPEVARTESVLDVIPGRQPEKRAVLQRIEALLDALPPLDAPLPTAPDPRPALELLLGDVEAAVRGASGRAPEVAAGLAELLSRLDALSQAVEGSAPAPLERLAAYERRLRDDLRGLLGQLRQECQPPEVSALTLPDAVRGRFVSRDGARYLLRVYPRGGEPLTGFLEAVQREVPDAGGMVAQLVESDRLFRRGYVRAVGLASIFLLGYLLVHFQGVARPLAVALTLGVGLAWGAGVLTLLGVSLNPANVIALPLTIGIGVDYALHFVHRHQEAVRTPTVAGPAPLIATSTGRAVTLSAATSLVGFGALALCSHHRGIASVGWVCCAGIACSALSALIFCPALLRWSGAPPLHPFQSRRGPKTQ